MTRLQLELRAENWNHSFDSRAEKYGKEVALEWVKNKEFPKKVELKYEFNPFMGLFEIV